MLLAFRLVAFSPTIAFWKLSIVLATGLEHQWAVVLTDVHAFASSVPILLWLLALFDVDEVRVVGGDEDSCGVGDRNCGRSVDWRGRDKHCEAAEDIDPAKDGFEDRHDGGFLAVGVRRKILIVILSRYLRLFVYSYHRSVGRFLYESNHTFEQDIVGSCGRNPDRSFD